jgi:hypothetical protein
MRSLNSRNHSNHMPTRVRTRHNKVTPVHRYRQLFIIVAVLLHTALQVVRHLSKLIMETMENYRMQVHLWVELQSLLERQAALPIPSRML